MKQYDSKHFPLTKYLFFTGKGGVGKTSLACATAVTLADNGKKVLLISTDPASNLQDVFETKLDNKGVAIKEVPNLIVVNLDPVQAAAEYKEKVVSPYRGKLPGSVIANMEEQLSGSCTVEIAAFNEFSNFITDEKSQDEFDHIIFDTAPTGHTLRMLQLPAAWSNFISESTHGASCLGQLAGLEEKKDIYKNAVQTLTNSELTTLVLVSRPETTPLKEADRASAELISIGVKNQILVLNGVLQSFDDYVSKALYTKQQKAIENLPNTLKDLNIFYVLLRSFNVTGVKNVRALLTQNITNTKEQKLADDNILSLQDVVNDLVSSNKKVIFTMGKGGVGKTTIAASVALALSKLGKKVHLTTTDPAAHLQYVINESSNITISRIDEEEELRNYTQEVLAKAKEVMSEEDLAYIEEDLRSPCTQEIAVFRAFAQIVDKADNEVVVIDTAPTGHTLLLLDATQSYHKEVKRTQGEIPQSVKKLLPRLRNEQETAVLIVTLAETTPFFEAMRLEEDLKRANIPTKWWIINSSLYATQTTNALLKEKANSEIEWINKVSEHSNKNFALIKWMADEVNGLNLLED